MEQSVQLILDALASTSNQLAAPAFDALVKYTYAGALGGVMLGSAVLVFSIVVSACGYAWVARGMDTDDEDMTFVGFGTVAIGVLVGIFGGVFPLALNFPSLLAPEGSVVHDLLTRLAS